MLSMWPLIHSDDQIADLSPQQEYDVDDIIIFREFNNLVAHRIIYKPLNAPGFITKGDNNRVSDELVQKKEILGKAISIKRKSKIIKIETIYAKQSDYYLQELAKFQKLANHHGLKYIILKGMPIYFKYKGLYPRHFIFDADILIHPVDLELLHQILKVLKFKVVLPGKDAKEFSAIKQIEDQFVSLDLHLEPAIAFSQFPHFNQLIPQIQALTEELWQTSRNHFLTPNHEFIYLLLHALHHSYSGTTRWDLLKIISTHHSVDPSACVMLIKKLKVIDLVYGSLKYLENYYDNNRSITFILKRLRPKLSTIILTKIIIKYIKPWTHHHHFSNRLELLIYLLVISPLSLTSKLRIMFYAMRSIDFKVFKNWAKSRLA